MKDANVDKTRNESVCMARNAQEQINYPIFLNQCRIS
jgi:hypothetical protein